MKASFSFVPTPSADATSTGAVASGGTWKRPPKLPISESTPVVNVPRASDLMRRTVSLPASMSTPLWR